MDTPLPQKGQVDIDLNQDYISNLPTDIKQKILVKLPVKEMIRTSILSSKWIDSWNSVPNLVFEENLTEYRLINLVDKVLLAHQGPIEKFRLVSEHSCCKAIGGWMRTLSRNEIRELELRFVDERCKIPSRLFSCLALEHVNLTGCIINVPMVFEGFKLVHTLSLFNFDLSGINIENLVSACPLLQNLTLADFSIEGFLHIFAPNLLYLHISGKLDDICLETPKLMSGFICLCTEFISVIRDGESNITRALGFLSNIQKLDIREKFIEYLSKASIPENLPTIFNHLTELRVYVCISSWDEIATALCLFQNAPNLEVLHIEFWPFPVRPDDDLQDLWKFEAFQDCIFKRLKIVNIMYQKKFFIKSAMSISEFAKFVLSTAPVLEKLNFINFEKHYGSMTSYFKMLDRFPKLSKNAKVVSDKTTD